jgi:hypothetical protein
MNCEVNRAVYSCAASMKYVIPFMVGSGFSDHNCIQWSLWVFVILNHNPVKTNLFDLVVSATCICVCSNFKNKICSCCRVCVCVQNMYKDALNEAGSPPGQFQYWVQVLEDNHKLLACTGGELSQAKPMNSVLTILCRIVSHNIIQLS